jgi:hypothetical protein
MWYRYPQYSARQFLAVIDDTITFLLKYCVDMDEPSRQSDT